ncbi:hypothetical protein B0A50_01075 [Salinomyces thailandicus]|uniref:Uncharacterized protein n=1 Tax=Salinomyces thailandicus TaxID=706561 RepID=A0A4V5N5Y8_9PEZI|nr:hypothetical protein B0A50_01075 [Salinomyces thailandica]
MPNHTNFPHHWFVNEASCSSAGPSSSANPVTTVGHFEGSSKATANVRRNSFDFVTDAAKQCEAEAKSAQTASTNVQVTQPPRIAATGPSRLSDGFVRETVHTGKTRTLGWKKDAGRDSVELKELPRVLFPRSNEPRPPPPVARLSRR